MNNLSFAEALARQEGYGKPGGRATRNNNPGNINWGPFAQQYGATRIEIMPPGSKLKARFAYFPDSASGMAAARALLNKKARFDVSGNLIGGYLGATVRQVISRWAPPIENDTEAYIRNVCAWTQLTPETVLTVEML